MILPDLGTYGDIYGVNKSYTTFEKIFLPRLIVLRIDDLITQDGEQYSICNIIPNEREHPKYISYNEPLKIAVSPLTRKWLLKDKPNMTEDEYGNRNYFFEIEGLTDEAFVHSRVKKAYEIAAENGAQMLIFPEMYGTETLAKNPDDVISDLGDKAIPLVVMPSWWHDRKNEAYVVDESLVSRYRQNKQFGFVQFSKHNALYENDSLEYLARDEKIVYILHLPKVGRIVITICKDFLMASYRRMIVESLEASFLIVPSFTESIEHFCNGLDSLKQAGCYGVFVNCCAGILHEKPDHIDESIIAGKVSTTKSLSFQSPKYMNATCKGECGDADTECVFIICISLQGEVSIEHKYKKGDAKN